MGEKFDMDTFMQKMSVMLDSKVAEMKKGIAEEVVQKMKPEIKQAIEDEIRPELSQLTERVEKLEKATGQKQQNESCKNRIANDEAEYDLARRSIVLFPYVSDQRGGNLIQEMESFLEKTFEISSYDMSVLRGFSADILHSSPLRQNPVKITFKSRDSRDFIFSRASKLAGKNINCDIVVPPFLRLQMTALSKISYNIRQQRNLKTTIRLDDSTCSLSIFVKEKGQGKQWEKWHEGELHNTTE